MIYRWDNQAVEICLSSENLIYASNFYPCSEICIELAKLNRCAVAGGSFMWAMCFTLAFLSQSAVIPVLADPVLKEATSTMPLQFNIFNFSLDIIMGIVGSFLSNPLRAGDVSSQLQQNLRILHGLLRDQLVGCVLTNVWWLLWLCFPVSMFLALRCLLV